MFICLFSINKCMYLCINIFVQLCMCQLASQRCVFGRRLFRSGGGARARGRVHRLASYVRTRHFSAFLCSSLCIVLCACRRHLYGSSSQTFSAFLQAAKQAVENSEALKNMNKAIQDTIGPVGEIDIPEKHAFLAERLHEFNATIPYSGFSREFLDQMSRPGRFEKEPRRKAFAMLEAVFCLLPAPKKVCLRF